MKTFKSVYELIAAITREDEEALDAVWYDKERFKRRLEAVQTQFMTTRYIHTLYLPLYDEKGNRIGYYPHDTYKYLDMMVESYEKKEQTIIYVWNVNSEIKRAFADDADVIFVTNFY